MGSVRHSPQTRARVIELFSEHGRIDVACELAGVDRSCHYDWLDSDAQYAAAFEKARRKAVDALESEAWRRAKEGTEKPVFQQGREVGRIREYSDTLMTWLLKGHRPERYSDKVSLEHSGPGGGPIPQKVVIELVSAQAKEITK